MDKINYYVKEVMKNRIELPEVPEDVREKVEQTINHRKEIELMSYKLRYYYQK